MDQYSYNQQIYDVELHNEIANLIKSTIPSTNIGSLLGQRYNTPSQQSQEIGNEVTGKIKIECEEQGYLGNQFKVEVVEQLTPNQNMSVTYSHSFKKITVTLGTDIYSNPDNAKNRQKLIQREINRLPYFYASFAGDGEYSIQQQEQEKGFTGGVNNEPLYGVNLFVFNEPLTIDYVTVTYNCIKDFIQGTFTKLFGRKIFDPNRQMVFISPHETFNFQKRFENKDYKLPLVLVRVQYPPMAQDLHSNIPFVMYSEGFMFNTSTTTKDFIRKLLYEYYYNNESGEITKEQIRNMIFPTIYYDQVQQKTNITVDIIQETERDLQNVFVKMNTQYFMPIVRKFHYLLSLDQLISKYDIQLKEIQERFQFPIFYLNDYTVKWQDFSVNTKIEKDTWNLQRQTYTFEFTQYPITRFNLQGTILRIDTELQIQESNWEEQETISSNTIEM